MASIKLGKIERLDTRNVTDNAIAVLATRLRTPPSGFFVTCCLCGTERHHPTLIDPGQIVHERFTCRTVNKVCCPVRAEPALSGYGLVPGSLVFAPYDPPRDRFWPAIVEDSPDNYANHIATVQSRARATPITAYYVTFIHIGPWLGGWFRAESLSPFSKRFECKANSRNEALIFRDAVKYCDASLSSSLAKRLLRYSFVAQAARERGILRSNNSDLGETIGTQIMYREPRDSENENEMDWESDDLYGIY